MSGRTAPVKLAEILAAYERGEIDVLINAMLLAEGWNSPRATVGMHLAPTASRRVYQQRIGRIMRMHPRKEAGIVVDFVPKGATHNERVVSLHSLLDADFYREGARVTPAPRRRVQRRARRKLTPAPWLVPVTPDVARRLAVIQREWQRVDPKYLDDDEQRFWATIAGRQMRFDERAEFVQKLTESRATKGALETVPLHLRRGEPEPPAAADRAPRPRLDERRACRLRRPRHARDPGAALGEGPLRGRAHAAARDRRGQAGRARPDPRPLDVAPRARPARRSTAGPAPSTRTRNACSARSRTRAATGTRRTRRLVNGRELPREVGAALLASAEGYTPRANNLLDAAREKLGEIHESPTRSPTTFPRPRRPVAHRADGRRKKERRRRSSNSSRGQPRAAGSRSATAGHRPASAGRAAPTPAAAAPRRKTERRDAAPRGRLNEEHAAADRSSLLRRGYPSMLVLLGIGFLAGLVTAISPCVLPVLPILLAGGATGRKPLGSSPGWSRASSSSRSSRPGCSTSSDCRRTCSGTSRSRSSSSSRATLLVPQSASCSSDRSPADATPGGAAAASCSGSRLGLVFVPCAGPVLAGVRCLPRTATSASTRCS